MTSHDSPQPPERGQHLFVGEIRVSPARIRQHEHPRAFEAFGLQTQGDRLSGAAPEDGAEQRHADKHHEGRPQAPDLSFERTGAGDVFLGSQRIDARCRTRNQIGEAQTPFGQPAIVLAANRLGHQPRLVQQFPEAVRITGEMMARGRRADAGIDADKQDADGSADAVAQRR